MRFLFLLLVVHAAAAADLTLHRWSGDLNVPDPVACTVDERGRVYVAATTRRKVADLDIREHPQWIADDVGLTSVEEKRAFLKRELAPGKTRVPRGGLKDHNRDGSIDWKDLTVHSERIYQLRDDDGDGTADRMTVFAEGFNAEVTGIAAGLLYHDGWVYATIAPDLWRLKDTDDDGVADVREVVAHGFGMHIAYAGHDMHGPRLGPDGRIYWSIGDKGVNVTDRQGRRWYHPHEGAVMRVEPDGSGFEVFAHGLRNVQEVAFDDLGNLFGVDNDADMPGEQERFVYIAERSDSGWRCSHQYMKSESRWVRENLWKAGAVQALFITPPLANYSNGPAGFLREPGTALGRRLRGHFLLNQFPSGKMEAFTVEADGAAFRMSRARLVNSGIMGIGMSWAADGSFYMADWMGGYPLDEKGAIWRVDVPEAEREPGRRETQALLQAGFAATDEAGLTTLLGHADQRVRVAAQLELARRGRWSVFTALAQDATRPLLARVHALWGCGIGLRRGQTPVASLLAVQPGLTAEPELLAQWAKVLGDGPRDAAAGRALTGLLDHVAPRVRFFAAIALGKLEVAEAAEALLHRAASDAGDAWLRHAWVTGLAGCAEAGWLAAQAGHQDASVRLLAALALARQQSPQVAAFLQDADPAIVAEAARAIHDDDGIADALPALARLLAAPRALPEAALRRAINANLRLGGAEAVQRLLDTALRPPVAGEPATAAAARLESLQCLLAFTAPPQLDRIDGVNRRFPPRDRAELAAAVQPRVEALLAVTDSALKAAAIELMVQLELRVGADVLAAILADPAARAELRAGALQLMGAQHAATPAFAEALRLAAGKAAPTELRQQALAETLAHRPEAEALVEVSRVLEQGTLAEKQAALRRVATRPGKAIDGLLERWLQRLTAGKVEAGLKLDVLEAVQGREALAERVSAYQQARASAPRDDLLEGGDAAGGREIVSNHLGANCIACHTVEEKEGSQVGPLLRSIGAQRSRAELLESLVNPVAKIAPGYGLVSVTLKDGRTVAGTLLRDDPASVTLRQTSGEELRLNRAQVAMQTPPVSMMPPMLGILTPRELRDVVAYLASLKPKPAAKKASR